MLIPDTYQRAEIKITKMSSKKSSVSFRRFLKRGLVSDMDKFAIGRPLCTCARKQTRKKHQECQNNLYRRRVWNCVALSVDMSKEILGTF